jgi:hypothetical protein
MTAYTEELVKAGVILAGEGLHPSSKAARVEFADTERKVIDGPFAETQELLGGFWLWQVTSMDEAIEFARRGRTRRSRPNPPATESGYQSLPHNTTCAGGAPAGLGR